MMVPSSLRGTPLGVGLPHLSGWVTPLEGWCSAPVPTDPLIEAPAVVQPLSPLVRRFLMRLLLRRLTYANVAATLALFFALGGTAVAGAKLLITGATVENHSLTGVDIENGSLGLNAL